MNTNNTASVPVSQVGGSGQDVGAGNASLASELLNRAMARPAVAIGGGAGVPIGGSVRGSGPTSDGEDEVPATRFSLRWFVLGTTVLVVGGVSLLAALDYLPDINWVWVLVLLGMAGASLLGGVNKVSFVLAGTFFAASVGSVLRQTGHVKLNVEVPVLIMFAGVLILLAMALKLRTPTMMSVGKRF
jgi:hypothetical protein